jgi:Fe-S cluster assembly protein SufB
VIEITASKGRNHERCDDIRLISSKKGEPEWLLEWRLKAYRYWLTIKEPTWHNVHYPPIDYQGVSYYAAPKKKELQSLDEVDPELLRTYEKLGIPLEEQKMLSGVAVDAVFDSVSVATTFKDKLAELGIIFCPFSEAAQEHPELVRKYLGSVVPYTDNFFATLNSAVFTDGSFCYIPKGVRCPMELSTYFRINAQSTGQFERTLIIAEPGSYVSYLEGCTAPPRSSTQPSRTGIPATRMARAAFTTLLPSAASAWGATPISRGRRWKRGRPSLGSTRVACWLATTPWASFIRWR